MAALTSRIEPIRFEERPETPWDAAAPAWTRAVREARDPGRTVAEETLVRLVRQVPTGPILDAGCGEGWFERALITHRDAVTAFDGSRELLALAQAAAPDAADYLDLTFDEAVADPRRMGGAYGTVVFSFSLLEERITPILEAAGAILFPYGRIFIQAAHPSEAHGAGDGYRDGWRTLAHAAPGVPLEPGVPWYFRTFSRWILELRRAGLLLVETFEPLHPETGRPVSLIIHATIPERRKREVRGRFR